MRFTEMEYAIPRERAAEALERVLALIERRRLPVGVPDRAARGGARRRLPLHRPRPRRPATSRCTSTAAWSSRPTSARSSGSWTSYGGRPHWGKRHYQSAHTLAPRYPDWERFQAVRRRFDPEGRFANDYTDRVLGPVVASGSPAAAAGRASRPGRRACAPARAACARPPAARKGARRVAAAAVAVEVHSLEPAPGDAGGAAAHPQPHAGTVRQELPAQFFNARQPPGQLLSH